MIFSEYTVSKKSTQINF